MEICQHCEQHMKPFFNNIDKCASCEFCGRIVAEWKPTEPGGTLGRWTKREKEIEDDEDCGTYGLEGIDMAK